MGSDSRLRPLMGIGLLLLGGCSCGAGDTDAGDDTLDVVDVRAEEDVPPIEDAGPWRPAFAPRIIYENPDVTCTPVDLTYAPAARPPASPGTVRWVYQPLDDHAAREALATVSAHGFIFGTWSIFGTSDGGLAVNVDLDRGTLLVVRPDGVLRTALQGYYTQVRLTVAPGDGVLRALGDQPIMRWGASAISAYGPELPVLETLPGRIRTELIIPGSGGLTYQPDPVVLENGTIIWSPTTKHALR